MNSKKISSILRSLIFLVIGIIFIIYDKQVKEFMSTVFGILFIAIGVYKIVGYIIQDRNEGIVNKNELLFGICALVLGIIFSFIVESMDLIIRLGIGFWLILSGLSKFLLTFSITDRNVKFYSLFLVGALYLGLAVFIISNSSIKLVGICTLIYGLSDFISYFVYKNNLPTVKKDKYKNDKIEEAEIIEETDSEQ